LILKLAKKPIMAIDTTDAKFTKNTKSGLAVMYRSIIVTKLTQMRLRYSQKDYLNYSLVRDGNQTTVPKEHLPKDYQAPSFRIFGTNLFGSKKNKDL